MAPTTADQAAGNDHLDGWKAVAAHLGRSVRTVQRWERERGLPVHRVAGSMDTVFAIRTEVDAWRLRGTASGAVNGEEANAEVTLARSPSADEPAERSDSVRSARRRRRALGWTAIVVVALIGVGIVLSLRSVDPDAVLFDTSPYPLAWKVVGGSATKTRLPNGMVVDPTTVTASPRTVVFEFVKTEYAWSAKAAVIAPLSPVPERPRMAFTYVPDRNGRSQMIAGFMDGDRVKKSPGASGTG